MRYDDYRMKLASWRFVGDELDLIRHGFRIKGRDDVHSWPKYAVRKGVDAKHDIYIGLNAYASGGKYMVQFNDFAIQEDIRPHIKDLIDAGLVTYMLEV